MAPPPIRYPLPTLVILLLLGGLVWWGGDWLAAAQSSAKARWNQWWEGPGPPSSSEVQVVAGAWDRRVLTLRENVIVSPTPNGPLEDVIRQRIFANVYDVWPIQGEPTHYRIGNRQPIGWVAEADVLPWDTRLVIRPPSSAIPIREDPARSSGSNRSKLLVETPMPVISWTENALKVATWVPDRPWAEVDRIAWISLNDLSMESWGVWLSREELLELIRRLSAADSDAETTKHSYRLQAILGRITDRQPIAQETLAEAEQALPATLAEIPSLTPNESAEQLARINERWNPDAAWGSFEFRWIPLQVIP